MTNEQLLSHYRDDSKLPYLSEVVYTVTDVAQMLDAAREDEAKKYEAQLKAERERAGKLMEALRAILKEPYGCRFCDSGKLRKPNNPDKDHDYDCGYLLAKTAINEYNNKP